MLCCSCAFKIASNKRHSDGIQITDYLTQASLEKFLLGIDDRFHRDLQCEVSKGP